MTLLDLALHLSDVFFLAEPGYGLPLPLVRKVEKTASQVALVQPFITEDMI